MEARRRGVDGGGQGVDVDASCKGQAARGDAGLPEDAGPGAVYQDAPPSRQRAPKTEDHLGQRDDAGLVRVVDGRDGPDVGVLDVGLQLGGDGLGKVRATQQAATLGAALEGLDQLSHAMHARGRPQGSSDGRKAVSEVQCPVRVGHALEDHGHELLHHHRTAAVKVVAIEKSAHAMLETNDLQRRQEEEKTPRPAMTTKVKGGRRGEAREAQDDGNRGQTESPGAAAEEYRPCRREAGLKLGLELLELRPFGIVRHPSLEAGAREGRDDSQQGRYRSS